MARRGRGNAILRDPNGPSASLGDRRRPETVEVDRGDDEDAHIAGR